MQDAPLFLLTSLALVGSPGPNTLGLAALGAAWGMRRSLGFMAGLDLGMAVLVGAVGSGLWAVTASVPGLAPVATAAASLWLLYLAWRIAMAPPLGARDAQDRQARPPSWRAGALLSLSNPKAWLAVAAVFSRYAPPEAGAGEAAAKGAALWALIVAVNLGWLAAGAALGRAARTPARGRAMNRGFAALLALSVIGAALL